ncbi:MAG: BatD family protein [Gammaproteobacteria bacterium]
MLKNCRHTVLLRAMTMSMLLLAAMSLVPVEGHSAQIHVSVDRNPVSIDESFQIVFAATEAPDDDPDFNPLEQDFNIIGQSTSSNATWVNGKASKTIQWTLTVMAKQAGTLMIPAVRFGKDISPTLNVVVNQDAKSHDLNSEDDIFLQVEAVPKEPHVQSQVIYTVRIYSRVDIARASLNEPELEDAVIEKLGDDGNFSTQINGVDYSVTERKYAIFPQKSGPATIKPVVLSAEVLSHSRPGFNSFFNAQFAKTQRVSSRPVVLNVKPVPPAFSGARWLSAEQLELKEEWSGDTSRMKVGEPLTRTLIIRAKGATVGQLPELNTAKGDDSVKMYPDQPVLKEQKNSDGLIAFRQEKIALIPSKAGSHTLPAIQIPWFNTLKGVVETAVIPAVTITAVAVTGGETAVLAPAMNPARPENTPLRKRTEQGNPWPWVSLFLAVGWMTTAACLLGRRAVEPPAGTDSRKPLDEDGIRSLKKACAENDPMAAKNALIGWGRQHFDAASLGAIAMCCDARLRDEILMLNRILYSRESLPWQGKKLFQAFSENKARKQFADRKDRSLEPLYRL